VRAWSRSADSGVSVACVVAPGGILRAGPPGAAMRHRLERLAPENYGLNVERVRGQRTADAAGSPAGCLTIRRRSVAEPSVVA
jgi:hypothetical protein